MVDPVALREVESGDLEVFFEHQADPEATAMAAFPSRDRATFLKHWQGIRGKKTGLRRTIIVADAVAGYVVCFEQAGRRLIGYWIGREFWGRGIATRALAQFLDLVPERPLEALVAKRNRGSIRVLEKCGFERIGEGTVPDLPGDEIVEEYVYSLGRSGGPN
jgi:RimJ/RimL family protein N-acetyltransferase